MMEELRTKHFLKIDFIFILDTKEKPNNAKEIIIFLVLFFRM